MPPGTGVAGSGSRHIGLHPNCRFFPFGLRGAADLTIRAAVDALTKPKTDLPIIDIARDRLHRIDPRIRLDPVGLDLPDDLSPQKWAEVGRTLMQFPQAENGPLGF